MEAGCRTRGSCAHSVCCSPSGIRPAHCLRQVLGRCPTGSLYPHWRLLSSCHAATRCHSSASSSVRPSSSLTSALAHPRSLRCSPSEAGDSQMSHRPPQPTLPRSLLSSCCLPASRCDSSVSASVCPSASLPLARPLLLLSHSCPHLLCSSCSSPRRSSTSISPACLLDPHCLSSCPLPLRRARSPRLHGTPPLHHPLPHVPQPRHPCRATSSRPPCQEIAFGRRRRARLRLRITLAWATTCFRKGQLLITHALLGHYRAELH